MSLLVFHLQAPLNVASVNPKGTKDPTITRVRLLLAYVVCLSFMSALGFVFGILFVRALNCGSCRVVHVQT